MAIYNHKVFEIRIKKNGRTFCRHYEAKSSKHAAKRAAGLGKIIFVRKVHLNDIIGTIESMGLQSLIGAKAGRRAYPRNVVTESTTLEEMIFPRRNSNLGRDKGRNEEE